MRNKIQNLMLFFICVFSFSLFAQENIKQSMTPKKESKPYTIAAAGGGAGEDDNNPRTPTSGPILTDGYHPVNSTYTITFPPRSATYYKLYESTNNSTYTQVYSGSNFFTGRSQSNYGYRYYKYKNCSASGCSGYSPYSRLYVYRKPNTPSNFTVSRSSFKVNDRITLTWGIPSYILSNIGYYQINEIRPNGSSVVLAKITNRSTTTKTVYPANGQGRYTYQIMACNETPSSCSAFTTTHSTLLNTPPVARVNYLSTVEDAGWQSVNVLNNDSDADTDTLTISAVGRASHGSTSNNGSYVKYTPANNYFGTDSFTYTASDGHGGSASAVVNVSVAAVNDTPTISHIANQSTNEDTTRTVSFTVNDIETNNSSLTLSRTSSNTSLLPSSRISFDGSGSNRTLTLRPNANKYGTSTVGITVSDGSKTRTGTFVLTVNAVNDTPTITNISNQSTNEDVDKTVSFSVNDIETNNGSLTLSRTSSNTTLLPTSNITFGGSGSSRSVILRPVANKYGSATVGITVSDGSKTRTDTFVLTVNSVNDTPTITNISNQSTNEDVDKTVSFSVNDIETNNGSLTLSRTSSNTTLLPTSNITFGGSGSSRSVILRPVANKYGSATVGITVSDGSKTRTDTFVLTVNSVNDTPTITNISNQSTNEDVDKTVSFSVNDIETNNGSLTLSRTSSNTTLLPTSNITFGGSGSSRSVILRPVVNKYGSTTVGITVSDGSKTRTDTFVLTVNAVNDTPTISNIANQSTNKNITKNVSFTIDDVDTNNGSLTLSSTSSNTALIPLGNITFSGSGANRTITLSPSTNKYGSATVGITVSDGSASQMETFILTVNAKVVTFIHTDLLGSPVAETDENGDVL